MGKTGTALGMAFITVCIVLSGCSSNGREANVTNEGGFQAVEAEKGASRQPIFEDANILAFELQNRDDSSFDDIIATFSVKNTSDMEVDYFTVDFAYKDADGNVLCDDGRFNDFGVPAGKTSLMKTFSSLDESNQKGAVSEIYISSYSYQIGGKIYNVDLDSEKADVYESEDTGVVDFENANVLAFDYSDRGVSPSGAYEVGIEATNGGEKSIPYISIDMAYFDEDGNLLGTDGRFNDNKMDAGNFVSINSFLTEEDQAPLVSSYGVYAYEYRLAEDDENGFNHYEINLKTKQARGMHVDYQD